MTKRPGIFQPLRMFIARISGRVDKHGNIKPREEGYLFKTIVAFLLALVTIVGALVAWRSAVAGNEAGNSEDAGILAALNLQEATTAGSIQVSQHRAAHLGFYRNWSLAIAEYTRAEAEMAARPDMTQEEVLAFLRSIIEKFDLGLTDRNFLDLRYLTPEGGYDAEREQAEYLADAAQRKDVEPDPRFAQANKYRDNSVALIATLIVLAISLWLLAFAETIDKNPVKYVMAIGGIIFLVLGSVDAWLIEGGASLPDVYNTSFLISIISGALLAMATVAVFALYVARGRTRVETSAVTEQEAVGDEREESEGILKEVVTMLIATVTLFAAIVGWLQADAGARSDQAIRDAQRLAADALGTETAGRALVNFQYGTAYRTWEELTVQALSADKAGDTRTGDLYRNAMTETLKLSEELASPPSDESQGDAQAVATTFPAPQLLAPPYFDPARDAVDIAGYEADVYVTRRAELSERSTLAGNLENVWEDKANAYIVHLTLLAAALALFGLSLSFSGLARPLFLVVGTAITLVTAGSVWAVFSSPVKEIPLSAVQAYARGYGFTYRGDSTGAIAAYNEALSQVSDYATALDGRATANLALATEKGYQEAARDYEAAQAAGKDDALVAWNLGWTYYLLGRFDDSIKMSQHSLDLNPNQASVRLNLALAQLAAGRIDEAKKAYRDAMDRVTKQVADIKASGKRVPPSTWLALDAAGVDLESLFFRLGDLNLSWIQAPPKSAVGNTATVQKAAAETLFSLKSLVTALENTGGPPPEGVDAQIEDPTFGAKANGDEAEYTFAASFNSPVKEIVARFNYSGMRDGQAVEWKVFVNGLERPEFRTKYTWDKGESGEIDQVFGEDYAISNIYTFEPGDYIVELYVDNVLSQFGSFDIQP